MGRNRWIKASPNLGISVDLDDLREQARKAKELPSALTSFLTKRLNIWTRGGALHPRTSGGRAVGRSMWRRWMGAPASPGWISQHAGHYGLVLVFPPTEDDPYFRVLPRFWVPETAMHERSQRDQVPYDAWCRDGWITAIPGDVIDYGGSTGRLTRMRSGMTSRRSGLIAGGGGHLSVDGEPGHDGCPDWAGVRQHVGADEGVGEADRLARAGAWRQSGADVDGLQHGGDARCGGECEAGQEELREKIDGLVAMIMGLARATLHDRARCAASTTSGMSGEL